MTNARKVLCTNTCDEKGRNATNAGIPLQEENRVDIEERSAIVDLR